VAHDLITGGGAVLGIELGSTRIKACLIDEDGTTLAVGSHDWENEYVDRVWTYSLDGVWTGVQGCYADLVAQTQARHGAIPTSYRAIGVSAMMHGYLAFDEADRLLVPFRTWRNTSTGQAASELTALFGHPVPLRWSIAHLYQAVLDDEAHVRSVSSLTTLAGYVHRRLTGRDVLGVGDASGMFPIDPTTGDYDARMLAQFDELVADRLPGFRLADRLPEILHAGNDAGRLTVQGAALLDPSGRLLPGVPLCPPEGDAGTGMVATNAVSPRSANVSVGTSVFAMVVLDEPLAHVHDEIDVVTTPAGDPVAMVHCNNGASELGAWAGVFGEFAIALGADVGRDRVFEVLLQQALAGEGDGGGLLAYNYLSGEPITGLAEGRPLVVRTPDSSLTLANFMRAQLYGVFATLSLGMRTLAREGAHVDLMVAHGGLFRTEGVAQGVLAAAIDAPVAVGAAAGEGGAWGAALLAAYLQEAAEVDLATFLDRLILTGTVVTRMDPDPAEVAAFSAYLERYTAGLAVQRAATEAM
jgi:sugar (pentulose or hexulose) kinase